jgi:hypothetical protein
MPSQEKRQRLNPPRVIDAPSYPLTMRRLMLPSCRLFLPLACLLAMAAPAVAHVVPSMTVEMDFSRNRGFTMRVNLDPRLLLSDRPAELPSVPASWYDDQSQEEQEKTHRLARDYIRKNLKLIFAAETGELPDFEVAAIDGRDNKPLRKDTEEVHLLATGRTVIPPQAKEFQLQLGSESNVSLILLNHMQGQKEPVPSVIFPGETSPRFELKNVLSLEEALATFTKPESTKKGVSVAWMMRGIISLSLIVFWAFFLKKRRSAGPPPRQHRR